MSLLEKGPTSTSEIRVSIIIVNWNVRDLLRDCIKSIYNTVTEPSFEILVVDNGSNDGSIEMIRQEFPEICLLPMQQNLGFSRANNLAIKQARGEFIMLLNPDTLLWPEAVNKLIKFMEAHPEVGMVGPYTVDRQNQIQQDCARGAYDLKSALWEMTFLYALLPKSRIFGKYLMTWWDHKDSRAVHGISGACMLVRRQVVEEVGGLDEQFFMYAEDFDWCLRIRKQGWEIFFVHDAVITHLKNQSMKQVADTRLIEYYRAMYYYFQKHYGRSSAHIFTLIFLLGLLTRSIAWAAVWLVSPRRRSIAMSNLAAALAGLKHVLTHLGTCLAGQFSLLRST